MKFKLIFSSILLFFACILQPLSAVQELLSALPKPYVDSMAGAGTALAKGIDAIGMNPANLGDGRVKMLDLSFSHAQHIVDSTFEFLTAKFQLNQTMTLGAALGYFNSGSMQNTSDAPLTYQNGYYVPQASSDFHLGDFLLVTGFSWQSPWYVNAGVYLKNDFARSATEISGSFLFDFGATYTPLLQMKKKEAHWQFWVPSKVSLLVRDLGWHSAYLDENSGNQGRNYKDWRFGTAFEPVIKKSKFYQPSYTLEIGKIFGGAKRLKFIIGIDNRIIINPLLSFNLNAGFNAARESGERFAAGFKINWNIKQVPMNFMYTTKIYSDFKATHVVSYGISLDYGGKWENIDDMLLSVKRLVVQNKHLEAYQITQRYLRKYPEHEELNKIHEKLKVMLFRESFLELEEEIPEEESAAPNGTYLTPVETAPIDDTKSAKDNKTKNSKGEASSSSSSASSKNGSASSAPENSKTGTNKAPVKKPDSK